MKKSTERNRLRRLLKESYRLNKLSLLKVSADKEQYLRILFTLSNSAYKSHTELSFKEISSGMPELLGKISERIK
ncbi:MAG: hypothetical protein HOP31_01285 [Ignavibacteria bacterium]|nr:hypothetical protein [Ignavibacteria bacterium]